MASKRSSTASEKTTTKRAAAPKSRAAKGAPAAKGKASRRSPPRSLPRPDVDRLIDGLGSLLALAGVLTALAMLPSERSSLVQPWVALLFTGLGLFAPLVPVGMVVLGSWLVARRFVNAPPVRWYRFVGLALFLLAVAGLMGLVQQWREPQAVGGYAGRVGLWLAQGALLALGDWSATALLLFLLVAALRLLFEISLTDVARALQARRPTRAAPVIHGLGEPSEPAPRTLQLPLHRLGGVAERARDVLHNVVVRFGSRPVAVGAGDFAAGRPAAAAPRAAPPTAAAAAAPHPTPETLWALPPWGELLEDNGEVVADVEDIRSKTHLIEETLAQFGVPARVVEINRGPTVTQYGVEPGYQTRTLRGQERQVKVKVSAITSLHNDLALALAAQRIRIEAPVPGKSFVGIEVPNEQAHAVTLGGTMASDEFAAASGALKVALGRDVMGNALIADLARMPHLLIAGSTGSGKSVCINTIIASLICHNTPDQLKLMMIDPKMVELIGYNGIPHLIVPVVTDIERVVGLLRWTVSEMERRYKIFSDLQVRNVQAYNARALQQGEKTLPYIVLIIDELADLMMAAADQVEGMICRLAQMARATGIHLILATQRPSVDVVTGLIKANFPARIAFAVTSQIDSRVILDRPGAESLLGRGDMLYVAADSGSPMRAQGCFVSDRELEQLNHFWITQKQGLAAPRPARAPSAAPAVEAVQAVVWDDLLADEESDNEDELMPKAREIVRQAGSASISMLQRRLRVGYARAARLVDLLEEEGTIGASKGPGKTRRVFDEEPEPGSDEDPGFDPAWIEQDD